LTIDRLETRRLLLRPLELADAEQAQALFSEWDVVKDLNALFHGRTHRTARIPATATGMRLVGVEEKRYVSGRLLSELWEVPAEEWRAHRKLMSEKREAAIRITAASLS